MMICHFEFLLLSMLEGWLGIFLLILDGEYFPLPRPLVGVLSWAAVVLGVVVIVVWSLGLRMWCKVDVMVCCEISALSNCITKRQDKLG